MADKSGITIASLLPADLHLDDLVKEHVCGEPGRKPMTLAWDLVGSEVRGALRSVLDCNLLELLAEGWVKFRELQDYADPARHPPDERAVVHVGKHDFVREVHPVVSVTVAGRQCPDLRFTVRLTGSFSGLALAVQGGAITGGTAGDVHVSAQLRYGAAELHKARESRKGALPGTFRFDPPIPIPRRG
ncbi:MAG: hypothetical protein JO013_15495 [Alphaproteobacteria bacterium]|nr:hypothetical protein [Alphaproteobacteria bacterium]